MLNQLVDEKKLIGKTIKNFKFDGDEVYITFTDNSFIVLTIDSSNDSGYGYGLGCINVSECKENETNDVLYNLGLISKTDYENACIQAEIEEQKIIEKYKEQEKVQQEQYEENLYQKLKRKLNK